MKVKYSAKIEFKVNDQHPDLDFIKDLTPWTPYAVYAYKDTYYFNEDEYPTEEGRINYIKKDLKLVAGGGYNCKGIDDVRFEIIDNSTGEVFF